MVSHAFLVFKIQIFNRTFILLLGSCPRGVTWGVLARWGVKNFSVGICEGAPSTAHSSFQLQSIFVIQSPQARGFTSNYQKFKLKGGSP